MRRRYTLNPSDSSMIQGPISPRHILDRPFSYKKLRSVGGQMDEYAKDYRAPEAQGMFLGYVSVTPGGEGLHFLSIDGKESVYRSYAGEGRKLFNRILMQEFSRYFGARRNPSIPRMDVRKLIDKLNRHMNTDRDIKHDPHMALRTILELGIGIGQADMGSDAYDWHERNNADQAVDRLAGFYERILL